MTDKIHQAIAKDFEGHMDRYPESTIFCCISCDFECHNPLEILYHLNDHHNICIGKLAGLAMLPNYLSHWREHIPPFTEQQFYGSIKKTIDPNDPEEISIRSTLHKLRLDHIMIQHEHERTTEVKNIPCLFCKQQFTGTWHQYLQWLFEQHGFNPGRPANLVYIEELVSILRTLISNNQCIHCYQKFNTAQQLKNHMKKKPHGKIPTEPRFDRYYMVNYLEEDRKWHDIAKEGDDEIDEPLEEGLRDFDEIEVNETRCLICDAILSDPLEAVQHMRSLHGFDFGEIRKLVKNDFYRLVRFVNYARKMRNDGLCFVCGQPAPNYTEHVCAHEHKAPLDVSTIIDDDSFLKPVIEGDPLLTVLEDTD